MKIYCVECKKGRKCELVSGRDIYPNRTDLYNLPFWRCYECKNYVGCHYKAINLKTRPLGVVPNQALRIKRQEIHRVLDPIWKTKTATRKRVYRYLTNKIGREYHTAEIRNINEANKVILFLKEKFYPLTKNKYE